MGLSRRAYARYRGVSESAVRKAIAEGRISLELDGTIDPAKADAAWRSASNPIRPHNARASEPAVPPAATAPVPPAPKRAEPGPSLRPPARPTAPAAGEAASESGETAVVGGFAQARTVNEVLKAQERRVRLQKQKGELVDRARATATVFALARRERDAWIQWPARAAALIAADLQADPHRVEQVLEAHVRAHLAELAGIAVELR
jgi:hypothetical protein